MTFASTWSFPGARRQPAQRCTVVSLSQRAGWFSTSKRYTDKAVISVDERFRVYILWWWWKCDICAGNSISLVDKLDLAASRYFFHTNATPSIFTRSQPRSEKKCRHLWFFVRHFSIVVPLQSIPYNQFPIESNDWNMTIVYCQKNNKSTTQAQIDSIELRPDASMPCAQGALVLRCSPQLQETSPKQDMERWRLSKIITTIQRKQKNLVPEVGYVMYSSDWQRGTSSK